MRQIYGLGKISWQHTVCPAHLTFNWRDSATAAEPRRRVCTQALGCAFSLRVNTLQNSLHAPLSRAGVKEMPRLSDSVNKQVCNSFHDLLGGTQWFVFGSGAID